MIDRNSNTSRLVDKLLDKQLVQRESCPEDRRRVDIVLTEQGLELTKVMTDIMDADLSLLCKVWSDDDAARAIETLDAWNASQS